MTVAKRCVSESGTITRGLITVYSKCQRQQQQDTTRLPFTILDGRATRPTSCARRSTAD